MKSNQPDKSQGRFIKKRSKKSTNEAIPMSEQEHKDMLKVAKKLQLLENDQIDELENVPSSPKPTFEGLSEREVRVLVQDQFTPVASRQGHRQKLPIENNIQSGSGLPSTPELPFNIHDGTLAAMAAKIPIAPTMNLTDAEELIRQTKVAATSGDLFYTGRRYSVLFDF